GFPPIFRRVLPGFWGCFWGGQEGSRAGPPSPSGPLPPGPVCPALDLFRLNPDLFRPPPLPSQGPSPYLPSDATSDPCDRDQDDYEPCHDPPESHKLIVEYHSAATL